VCWANQLVGTVNHSKWRSCIEYTVSVCPTINNNKRTLQLCTRHQPRLLQHLMTSPQNHVDKRSCALASQLSDNSYYSKTRSCSEHNASGGLKTRHKNCIYVRPLRLVAFWHLDSTYYVSADSDRWVCVSTSGLVDSSCCSKRCSCTVCFRLSADVLPQAAHISLVAVVDLMPSDFCWAVVKAPVIFWPFSQQPLGILIWNFTALFTKTFYI